MVNFHIGKKFFKLGLVIISMEAKELRKKYVEFFKNKKHKEIKNSSLIPENDPTVLFTTAGMHPLVPFLLGEEHPSGKRLVNIQRCLRTGDIEEVGDDTHLTFFEMFGNWSLGDYWKKEAIEFTFEFLIKELKLDKNKLAVSVFKGDKNAPRDEESARVWENLGISKKKIAYLDRGDNFWGPAGKTGPCGPDTEIFYWNSDKGVPEEFDPNKSTLATDGKDWVEIGNNVFMQYNKNEHGKYEELEQKNVDFGGGYERIYTILEGKKSLYESSLLLPIVEKIKELAKLEEEKSIRKICDHIRAATFLLGDGVIPSNVEQGYVLRRLIRVAIRHGNLLKINNNFTKDLAEIVIKINSKGRPSLKEKKKFIFEELEKEEIKFKKTLEKGLRRFEKFSKNKKISGKEAFLLFQSFGFPLEMTIELSKEKKIKVNVKGYEAELKGHQELSRTATKGKFGSGLADTSVETTKLHTACHLLHSALQKVLKGKVDQRGSNINAERLRFDFSFDRKLTEEELKKVEDLINEKIKNHLEVKREEMSIKEAKEVGAEGVFDHKYGEKVFVYSIGKFSKEICSGPHVKNIKELGKFKIVKQKSVGSGVRRIKAILE
jgi:alanyl-tRNA synthetase